MDDSLVVVAVVPGGIAEEQIKSFLAAHGIETAVRGEAMRHTHGLTLDGLGQVEILVDRADETEARDLLQKAENGELQAE